MVVTERRSRRGILIAGDGVVLVLFALLGGWVHGTADPAVLLRTALPLLLAWAAASWAFGTYRRPIRTGWIGAWPVGILVGVLIRQVLVGRPLMSASTATFALVSLGVTGGLFVAWRAVAAVLEARTHAPEARRPSDI